MVACAIRTANTNEHAFSLLHIAKYRLFERTIPPSHDRLRGKSLRLVLVPNIEYFYETKNLENQSVENAGVANVKGANERNEFLE